MPMLASTSTSVSPRWKGRASAAPMRATIMSACAGASRSSHRTANSSPDRRASVSTGRSTFPSHSPTATSRSSPVRCPCSSLTALNRSRSRKSNAEVAPVRRARSDACCRRSSRRTRFGSPVSASCSAASRDWSDASCRSERACALIRYAAATSARVWAVVMASADRSPASSR